MSSDSPANRYARQIQFAPIGSEGHQSITDARVAILGAGALGTVAAEILARAGVGNLIIIDRDVVEWTNLQRQALYNEQDAIDGRSKADASCDRLHAINSNIALHPVVADVSSGNISNILNDVDLVIDAADNFLIRFLLNDWSLKTKTPWVHGGCVGAVGQVRLFTGAGQPCFRCLVPEPPPASAVDTCDTAGVVGSATHTVASLQSTEAIKWLSGNHQHVHTSLLSIDLWNNRFRELTISPSLGDSCPACGNGEYQFLEGDRTVQSEAAATLCGRDAVQITGSRDTEIDLTLMTERWKNVGRIQANPFFVRLFPNDTHSLTLFRDGRVVITGTSEISVARTLYDRFVGG